MASGSGARALWLCAILVWCQLVSPLGLTKINQQTNPPTAAHRDSPRLTATDESRLTSPRLTRGCGSPRLTATYSASYFVDLFSLLQGMDHRFTRLTIMRCTVAPERIYSLDIHKSVYITRHEKLLSTDRGLQALFWIWFKLRVVHVGGRVAGDESAPGADARWAPNLLKSATWHLAPFNVLKCAPDGGDSQKRLHYTKRSSLYGRGPDLLKWGSPRGERGQIC